MVVFGKRADVCIVDCIDADSAEPPFAETDEIELALVVAGATGEKLFSAGVPFCKGINEFEADFKVLLAHARTDSGANMSANSAEAFHGRNCVFQNAGEGAAPASVRRADDSRFGVKEQPWHAIGSEDAKRETRRFCH